MYAVIRTGGKQYKVSEGDRLRVEKLEVEPGATITFDQVLMVGGDKPLVGTPVLEGATVEATVNRQDRAKKILVFKKKRRKGYRRTQGHRQPFTELTITSIAAPAAE
jgi:large subunit ribosomal protein L21